MEEEERNEVDRQVYREESKKEKLFDRKQLKVEDRREKRKRKWKAYI